MWDTTKVTHSSNHHAVSFQRDDGTIWVCLKNQGAKQKWLKVSGTRLQSDVATIRFHSLTRKISPNSDLFFRMMFSHRRWSSFQLFCSFWTGEMTIQNTSQHFCMHSLSYLLLFAELRVAWAAVQCAPLQHFRLFSSSWSILTSARATCRRRNSSAQRCFSKGRVQCIWAQSLSHRTDQNTNLHRSELVLQSTKKTKAFGLTSHYKKMCNKRPQSHCVTAKECWHEQDFSSQETCSFISCSYVLVPHSSFFHLHYFLSFCFSYYYFSLYSKFAIHSSYSSTVTFFGMTVSPFLSPWLFFPFLWPICLCLVNH